MQARPELPADINQGNGPAASSYPDGFLDLDNIAYFSACSDACGELRQRPRTTLTAPAPGAMP